MPIAKLPDVRLALVFPVFRRRLPRHTVILVREYVEGAARSFDDVWPDAAAFDERKPGMESILEFLGEEARLILARTTHSVRCFAHWIWEPSAFPLWHYSCKLFGYPSLGAGDDEPRFWESPEARALVRHLQANC